MKELKQASTGLPMPALAGAERDAPSCYGDYRESPQDRAERECGRCTHELRCANETRITSAPPRQRTAAHILADAASTFRERNAIYGDNYKMVAKLVAVLFPNGVPSELVTQDEWHLFELKLVKLSRFAISGLTHIDSIHDDCVYSAMIESIIINKGEKK